MTVRNRDFYKGIIKRCLPNSSPSTKRTDINTTCNTIRTQILTACTIQAPVKSTGMVAPQSKQAKCNFISDFEKEITYDAV